MEHPPSVIDKAKRLEQVLLRIEQGESLKQARAALRVPLTRAQLVWLQAKYEASGRDWEALIEKRYGHPKKAHAALREWLYERKRQDDTLTATQLAEEIAERFEVELSNGHINYLLRQLELSGSPGRPRRRAAAEAADSPSGTSEDHAGIFFLEAAKQAMGICPVVEASLDAVSQEHAQTHSDTSLPAVAAEPETLWPKLDHLLYLPILGLTRPRDLY